MKHSESMVDSRMAEHILSGLRVIDCATYIAAPTAAMMLGDYGAEVIKIERPPHGDPYRYLHLSPGTPKHDMPYMFQLDNRNKKSVALDLTMPEAIEALRDLVKTADIFITNYQPQHLRKFNLEYETLAALNPRLIYAQITGFGTEGPDAEKPGYDTAAYYARSGLMDALYNAGSEPVLSPAGIGDHPTGVSLFAGILLALMDRGRSGKGHWVKSNLLHNGIWSNACIVQGALVGAKFIPRGQRAAPRNPLVNHYQSKDGKRFLLVLLEPVRDWTNLCRLLDWEHLFDDERFATAALRGQNAAALTALLDEGFAALDMVQLAALFAEHDLIWSDVPTTEEAAADPQLIHNGALATLEDGTRTIQNPVHVEGLAKTAVGRFPNIGEHTDEILEELGYSRAQIEKLTKR